MTVDPLDSTGAGDMFAGAFLYGITNNGSLKHAANLSCNLASLVVSQLGPRIRDQSIIRNQKNNIMLGDA